MKYVQLILILFLLSGCAIYSKSWIHSPMVDGGTGLRYHHVHGGATKNSPPNMVEFRSDDELQLPTFVSAQQLKQKHILGGVLIPVFPIFFLPAINHYEDDPNSLILRISIVSDDTLTINRDSIRVKFEGRSYQPTSAIYYQKTSWMGIHEEHPVEEKRTLKIKADSTDLLDTRFQGSIRQLSFLEFKYPIDAFEIEKFQLVIEGVYVQNAPAKFSIVDFYKAKQNHFFLGP